MSTVLPAAPAPAGGAVETVYRPASPVDVRSTLSVLGRGPHDPTTRWDAGGVWRTFRTPAGAATLRIRYPGADGSVRATAWGPGAEWAIDAVPALLGRDDDWDGLDVSGTPLLHDSRRRNAGLKLSSTNRLLEALLPAVIEQRVTSLEAYRSWARLLRWFGEQAPGPAPEGMRVVPTVAQWRGIPSWDWHRAGVDPGRARTAQAALAVAASLERAVERAAGQPDPRDAAARALQTIPGIGPWTAAETLQRATGDPDIVSVGDYHLAHYVGEALTGQRVDDDGMLELLSPWAGHRQRVIRLILASGHRFERRGPRITLQDHRWH
ncbi:3-methyladenine DNA glycosylase [Leifsonia sp. Root227]|uniref:DNA-3-methyladenine glycosylase family protein n=1 Tax=unclassified Leifsonia TaxID=2663824 RepID=UPI0006F39F8A|nr:DNA-3-methyladenine glycosylase [Leifsonia sp. Root227]KRC51548.1 3-methyladenine DNA glycosylase [Leifsonia sp. Root227]